jgi:16S rRNA (guanine527-N7)-methyltransferase
MLVRYLQLLARWNASYNLTAVRDPLAMVSRHVIDSAVVLPFVHGRRVLDVGTGAGLPGLILAVLRPELHCVLLDSSAKRLRFCIQAVAELRVRNVEIVRSRIEHYVSDARFSTVIARAFGTLNTIWQSSARVLLRDGRLLVMKGRYPMRELEELGPIRARARVVPLAIPGSSAPRHLVIIPASAGDVSDGSALCSDGVAIVPTAGEAG